MIEIGEVCFKPESVIAITDHLKSSKSQCKIWCGPHVGDYFVVAVSKQEAFDKINDYFGWHPDEQAIRDVQFEEIISRMATPKA